MRTHLTASICGKKHSVPFAAITHFTSGDKYVSAHHPGGELILDETLIGIEAEFGAYLTRASRFTLVKTHLIEHVIKHKQTQLAEIHITGVAETLRVSRACYPHIRSLLQARKLSA